MQIKKWMQISDPLHKTTKVPWNQFLLVLVFHTFNSTIIESNFLRIHCTKHKNKKQKTKFFFFLPNAQVHLKNVWNMTVYYTVHIIDCILWHCNFICWILKTNFKFKKPSLYKIREICQQWWRYMLHSQRCIIITSVSLESLG